MPWSGGTNGQAGLAADVLPVRVVQEARAPKGFRVHTITPQTAPLLGMAPGEKVSVRLNTGAARLLGVKRSKKPVLSVRDSQALRRAASAKKRVARIAKGTGLYVANNRPTCSTKRRPGCK
jgi:hypothetical protein